MVKNPIMTTRELAGYIKLNEKTVIRMAQSGKIPGVKIGNQWRFHLDTIDRYLQNDLVESSDKDLDYILNTKQDIIPLSRLTGHSYIEIDSSARNLKEVLSSLVDMAVGSDLTPQGSGLYEKLEEREKMLSTAVGNGIAFPHPRNPSPELFKEQKVIVLRLEEGIDFNAPDNKPVNIFFMPCATNEFDHIRLLAEISKFLHLPDIVNKITEAETKDHMMRLLLEFDREHLFSGKRLEIKQKGRK